VDVAVHKLDFAKASQGQKKSTCVQQHFFYFDVGVAIGLKNKQNQKKSRFSSQISEMLQFQLH